MKKVSILGATGSIGRSTLDLIERSPNAFEVVALTASVNVRALAEAARRTGAQLAVIANPNRLPELEEALTGTGCRAAAGPDALVEAAKGMSWESPRGPMSIDPETRDVIQTVYIREVQEVDGKLQNVIIDEIPNVKDPLHGAK